MTARNIFRKFGESCTMFFEICKKTDRHADCGTFHPTRVEVIIVLKV